MITEIHFETIPLITAIKPTEEYKKSIPIRAQEQGASADCDRHRACNNGKTKRRLQIDRAIGMGACFGTAKSMSDRITDGFRHSKEHWAYVGNSKYSYIALGMTNANGKWCVCV